MEHESIKKEVDKLLGRLIEIESEYHKGNTELIKRNKGIST